uniref:DEAD-box helicase OB fold domain-containing protein n=1 Tax=Ditylenchus dipsaci TaxID=166011 RepID=A0A915CP45_9BILA
MLKEGKHFDSVMDDEDKKDVRSNPQDDINNLEFSLVTDNRSLQKELTTHRLNDATATVVKMVIASGLYPQYAVVDPTNNFRVGHDQFAHCISKPFCVIHPNSAHGQIPETLQTDVDSEARSAFHQFIFFGLLLETSKSYLCNSCRIPSTFLLVTARNIVAISHILLCCDGFVELEFVKEEDCSHVLEKAIEIRHLFLESIDRKLNSDEYTSCRELEKKIVNFAKLQCPYSIRRKVNAPKSMDCGIFDENGEEHPLFASGLNHHFMDEEEIQNDQELDEEFDAKKVDEKKLRGRKFFVNIAISLCFLKIMLRF